MPFHVEFHIVFLFLYSNRRAKVLPHISPEIWTYEFEFYILNDSNVEQDGLVSPLSPACSTE